MTARAWLAVLALLLLALILSGCVTAHVSFASTPTISDKAIQKSQTEQESGQEQAQGQGQGQEQEQRWRPATAPPGRGCPKP